MLNNRTALAFSCLFLLTLCSGKANAADDLAAKVETVINGPDYKQAHWGLLVVDSQTGETIYAHNPDHLFLPASTTKLYSCSAALAALSADYRFETPVYRRGKLQKSRLDGDLILVATGDLTMGGRTLPDGTMAFKDSDHTYANGNDKCRLTETDPLAGLKSLSRQIVSAGIHHVNGEILIDDRLFAHARGSGSGPDMLSPIMINDNVVDVVIKPAREAGKPASVHLRPETAFVQMDALVDTVPADKKVHVEIHPAAPRSFVVRGQIPVKAPPIVRIYPVENPAEFARALFIETLRLEGVHVPASPFQPPIAELPERGSYSKSDQVASFTSPPFSEAIKVTLKVSHNLYASTLPLLVAAKNGKRTLADGLHLQRKQLQDFGVDVATISFGGGAGGANADAVTPRASVQLLRALARRPDYKALEAGLPVLGVDGTLADVVPADSPAKGKVRAKTGTLLWHDVMNERPLLTSKALAGIMTTAKGRALTLAIYVNGVPLPKNVTPSREGKVIGKLCEILYLNAP